MFETETILHLCLKHKTVSSVPYKKEISVLQTETIFYLCLKHKTVSSVPDKKKNSVFQAEKILYLFLKHETVSSVFERLFEMAIVLKHLKRSKNYILLLF